MSQPQRTALVTGAGRGIGRSTALALGRAGYRVGLLARSEAEIKAVATEIDDCGSMTCYASCDITDFNQVAAAVGHISKALGPCELLVNNAGTAGSVAAFLDTDFTEWWQVFETNLKGTACVSYHVGRSMVEHGGGRIVNITSMQGSKVAGAGLSYGASKAALMRFTESLDAELAAARVRIFDLSPGLVRTGMTAGRPDLDALPAEAWNGPELTGEYVLRLDSGRYDSLHARVLRVTDDLDELVTATAADPDARILRVQQPRR